MKSRPMHGLAETSRVGYGEPLFNQPNTKKRKTRKRPRVSITNQHRSRVRGLDEELTADQQHEHSDRQHWGLPSVPTPAIQQGVHASSLFSATLFLDSREDLKLHNCVMLREDYLRRIIELTAGHTRTAQKVRNGTIDSEQTVFLDIQEIVDLLDLIRFVTVEVVEGIEQWRRRRHHTCAHGTEAGEKHACGDKAPYIWSGINYLLKIPNDFEFLCGIEPLVEFVQFQFKRNPFLLKQAISPFAYANQSDLQSDHQSNYWSGQRMYSPPTIDMRRIRRCTDTILREERMHGLSIDRPLSRMQAYSNARLAQRETQWDQRMAEEVLPKLAAVVLADNVRLCFKRQEGFADGLLTYGEFGRAVHRLGQLKLSSQDELDWLTRKLDRANSGFVAFNDFCKLVQEAKKQIHQENRNRRQYQREQARINNKAETMSDERIQLIDSDHVGELECHTVENTFGLDAGKIGKKKSGISGATAQNKAESKRMRKANNFQEMETVMEKKLKELDKDIGKLLIDRNELVFELKTAELGLSQLLDSKNTSADDLEAELNSYATRAGNDYSNAPRLHIEYPKARQQNIKKQADDCKAWILKLQGMVGDVDVQLEKCRQLRAGVTQERDQRREWHELARREREEALMREQEQRIRDIQAREIQKEKQFQRKCLREDETIWREKKRNERKAQRRLAAHEIKALRVAAITHIQRITRGYISRYKIWWNKSGKEQNRLGREHRGMVQEEMFMRDYLARLSNKNTLRENIQRSVFCGPKPFGRETRPLPLLLCIVDSFSNPNSEVDLLQQALNYTLPGFFALAPCVLTPLTHSNIPETPGPARSFLGPVNALLNTSPSVILKIGANRNEFEIQSCRTSLIRALRPAVSLHEPIPLCVLINATGEKVNDTGKSPREQSSTKSGPTVKEIRIWNEHFDTLTVASVIEQLQGLDAKDFHDQLRRAAEQTNPVPSFLLLARALDELVGSRSQRPNTPDPAELTDVLLREEWSTCQEILRDSERTVEAMSIVNARALCRGKRRVHMLQRFVSDPRWPEPSYRQRPALSLLRDWVVATVQLSISFLSADTSSLPVSDETSERNRLEVTHESIDEEDKDLMPLVSSRSLRSSSMYSGHSQHVLQRVSSTQNFEQPYAGAESNSIACVEDLQEEKTIRPSVWKDKGGGVFDVRIQVGQVGTFNDGSRFGYHELCVNVDTIIHLATQSLWLLNVRMNLALQHRKSSVFEGVDNSSNNNNNNSNNNISININNNSTNKVSVAGGTGHELEYETSTALTPCAVTCTRLGDHIVFAVQEHMSGSYAYLSLNAEQILEVLLHASNGRLINVKTTKEILTMVLQSSTLVPVPCVKKGVAGSIPDSPSQIDSLMRLITIQVRPPVENSYMLTVGGTTAKVPNIVCDHLDDSDALLSSGLNLGGSPCFVQIFMEQGSYRFEVWDLSRLSSQQLILNATKVDQVTPLQLRGTIQVFEFLLGALEVETEENSDNSDDEEDDECFPGAKTSRFDRFGAKIGSIHRRRLRFNDMMFENLCNEQIGVMDEGSSVNFRVQSEKILSSRNLRSQSEKIFDMAKDSLREQATIEHLPQVKKQEQSVKTKKILEQPSTEFNLDDNSTNYIRTAEKGSSRKSLTTAESARVGGSHIPEILGLGHTESNGSISSPHVRKASKSSKPTRTTKGSSVSNSDLDSNIQALPSLAGMQSDGSVNTLPEIAKKSRVEIPRLALQQALVQRGLNTGGSRYSGSIESIGWHSDEDDDGRVLTPLALAPLTPMTAFQAVNSSGQLTVRSGQLSMRSGQLTPLELTPREIESLIHSTSSRSQTSSSFVTPRLLLDE